MFTKLILNRISDISKQRGKIYARVQAGITTGFLGLFSNAILFLIKIFVGLFSGSVAMIADAFNSLSDFASSILTIIGFRISGRRPDDGHPYGHQRFEEISGFIMALVMLMVGLQFIYSSVMKIMNPTDIKLSKLTIGLLVISVLIKLWQRFVYRKIGEEVESETLIAASQDSRNDAITTLGILLAALISVYFKVNLDGWIGLIVAIFIVVSSSILIHDFINHLMGDRPSEQLIIEITNQLEEYDQILGFHDLMIHEYGHDMIYAVVHVELDSRWSLDQAHEIVDKIERDFVRLYGINLVVHVDPLDIHLKKYSRYYMITKELIDSYHNQLTIHDFHVEQASNGEDLIQFDLRIPEDSKFSDDEWLVEINQALRKKLGEVIVQINFDHSGLGADHSLI